MSDPTEPPDPPDPAEPPPQPAAASSEPAPPAAGTAKPGGRAKGGGSGSRDQQIGAVLEIVGGLVRDQRRLEGQFNRLTKMLREQERRDKDTAEDEPDPNAPAPWVWFSPPAPDEPEDGEEDFEEDPQVFVTNFVAWYNTVFVGVESGRAKAIPGCWEAHPGLAMEVASLAFSWRAANLGPEASIKEAQYWLHQWRPGFADRLVRDWVHTDCVDGQHQATGAHTRDNRFVVNQPAAAPAAPPQPPPQPSPPLAVPLAVPPYPPGPPAGWNRP